MAPIPPAEDEAEPNPLLAKLDELLEIMRPLAEAVMNDGTPAEDEEPDELEALANPEQEPEPTGEDYGDEDGQAYDAGEGIQGEGAAFDPSENEDSVTVDPEAIQNARDQASIAAKIARDALRKVIADPAEYKRAAKDTADMIRKHYGIDMSASSNGYAGFVSAVKKGADAAAGKARDEMFSSQRRTAEQAQEAYDARNPHKKKEDK